MSNVLKKLLCVAVLQGIGSLSAQTRGTITATVVDRGGQPVVGATVAVVPAGAHGLRGARPECLTDEKGICALDIEFGKYDVTAKKTTDGYPDLTMHFYGHGHWPATAEITPESPAASTTVKLGPKAGSLVLHTVDETSGAPIKHLTVTLHPAADPHDFVSTSLTGPDPTILIPPDEEIFVTVSADGYQPWHLKEHSELSPGGAVHLHSQERQQITARLKHQ
jgi:hypothetical protein